MKKNRKNLNEVMGVPQGIIDVSEKIYQEIFDELKKMKDFPVNDENEIDLTLNGTYKISDQEITTLNIKISFYDTEKIDIPTVDSMAVSFTSSKLDFFRMQLEDSDNEIFLMIRVSKNPNNSYDEFIESMQNEKNEIRESLSHELAHSYSNFKKRIFNSQERSYYVTYSKLRFGIKPVDEFIFYLYFISAIENIVRPSEFLHYLKNNSATQKSFLKFFTDYRVYKELQQIKNFSYEKMLVDLENNMDEINKFLERNNIEPTHDSVEGKIETILKLLYINLIGHTAEEYRNILTSNFMEQIFGFKGEKQKVFEKFIRKLERFGDFNNMIKYEEKNFKIVADEMIKKLSKLYALLGKEEKKENQQMNEWFIKEYEKLILIQDFCFDNIIL